MSAALCWRDLTAPVLARTGPCQDVLQLQGHQTARVFSQTADHHNPRRLHSFPKRSLCVRPISVHHDTFPKLAFKQRNAPFHKLGSQFQFCAKLPRGLANSFKDLQILLADIHQSQQGHSDAAQLRMLHERTEGRPDMAAQEFGSRWTGCRCLVHASQLHLRPVPLCRQVIRNTGSVEPAGHRSAATSQQHPQNDREKYFGLLRS